MIKTLRLRKVRPQGMESGWCRKRILKEQELPRLPLEIHMEICGLE